MNKLIEVGGVRIEHFTGLHESVSNYVITAPDKGESICWNGDVNYQAIQALLADIDNHKAEIDRIMLEYCPDEMTPDLIMEWVESQASHEADTIDALKAEIARMKEPCVWTFVDNFYIVRSCTPDSLHVFFKRYPAFCDGCGHPMEAKNG